MRTEILFTQKALKNKTASIEEIKHDLVWFWGLTEKQAEDVFVKIEEMKNEKLRLAKLSWGGVIK
jgi:hypothetical protein